MPISILILMPYYNRPILVKNALKSILKANEYHQNWELGFFDDNSPIPGRSIVEEMLKEHLSQVQFYQSDMTLEDKVISGLILGRAGNYFMRRSSADVVIVLCDDDELVPTYLAELSKYYTDHPEVLYSYCHVHLYNPLVNTSDSVDTAPSGHYNCHREPINPSGKLDASQVSWRLSCCHAGGVWYPDTTKGGVKSWVRDTDRGLFDRLFERYGPAPFNGLVGEYKGIHDYQLVWHKRSSLTKYDQMVRDLGGKAF